MPIRTVQLDTDCTLPARAAVQTAETQRMATMALRDSSCIAQVYGPVMSGAVPECTDSGRGNRSGPGLAPTEPADVALDARGAQARPRG